ncbi:hypothetical protein [Cupriavidus sp. D39]|nr:hypothetical protein [Cupriavidus sp. D39]MCY0852910.1 hypothetical protein [Cupriavidus sp. D39]
MLDTAKGGVATLWRLHEMQSRDMAPLAIVFILSTQSSHRERRWGT